MQVRLRARRGPLCCAIAVLTVAFASLEQLSAAAIPDISSLQDLLNRGASQANGVQLGNDLFYNFTYSNSPAGGAPTPSQILVTSTDSGPGLRFAFSWSSSNGNDISTLIGYSLHVVDTAAPQQFVTSATLNAQTSVSPADPADNASVTESLGDNNGHAPFQQLTVFNGTTAGGPPLTMSQAINPPLRDFGVSNGITVHTAAGSAGNANITYVENIFGQGSVPEPGTLALIALAAGALLARRRRGLTTP